MPNYERDLLSGNRNERRSAMKRAPDLYQNEKYKGLLEYYKDTNNQALQDLRNEVTKFDGNMPAMVYRGNPVLDAVLSPIHDLHDGLPKIMQFYDTYPANTDLKVLNDCKDLNIYDREVRGISLFDIEKMDLDTHSSQLSPKNIIRINKMIRSHSSLDQKGLQRKLFPMKEQDRHVLQIARMLPASYFAQPDAKHSSSPELIKLRKNLTAYYDFYTNLIISKSLEPQSEIALFKVLTWAAPWLPQSLGMLMPARLGITPSSIHKLLDDRELSGSRRTKNAKHKIYNQLRAIGNDCYRTDTLPQDLQRYQHYDHAIDTQAQQILSSYYGRSNGSDEQSAQVHSQAQEMMCLFTGKVYQSLRKEIGSNKSQRVEVTMPEGHAVQKMTITGQKHYETIMVILHLSGGIHTTIEIDKKGTVYGIPPVLAKEYPHIQDVIIKDILTPLLPKPKGEEKPVSVFQPIPSLRSARFQEAIESNLLQESLVEKPIKKKHQSKSATIFSYEPPSLPIPEKSAEQPKYVNYSQQRVEDYLGKAAHQEGLVEGVMDVIRRFEQGHVPAKKVYEVDGKIVSIQYGIHYRIFLEVKENNIYNLLYVGNVKDAHRFFKKRKK